MKFSLIGIYFTHSYCVIYYAFFSSGEKTITVKIPDTITTWYASGFALSSIDGIGIASPASVRAFQPFFISLALPYSVIRGEGVKIPTTVFNYLDDCLVVCCLYL